MGEWISFLCFNLGATQLTIAAQKAYSITFPAANDDNGLHTYVANEENLYGDLYQWGRIGDGHEKRQSAAAVYDGGTITYEDGNILSSQRYPWQQVARANATFYGKFIRTAVTTNYNWYTNTANIDQLWRGSVFAPNDPCQKITADGLTYSTYYPPTDASSTAGGTSGTGWHTPSQDEWGALYKGGTFSGSPANAQANTWTWFGGSSGTNGTKGYELKPDGVTTTLFLPACGNRLTSDGSLYYQGSGGTYWSATVAGTNAYYLNFSSSDVVPASTNYRGYGFALRCVKN
jgi:uncharacterized protein (TIGR02145 family)